MYEQFGAQQVGKDPDQGEAEFQVFFPDPAQLSVQPGSTIPDYGDPKISRIQVAGSFQQALGQPNDWDLTAAPDLKCAKHSSNKGSVWTYRTPTPLPKGFYEYKYYVTFKNGETRWVSDPCSRYDGTENQNSAFVIGGSFPTVTPLGSRKHLRDLVVYELMIDDFTDEYRGALAPLDAVRKKLDHMSSLGINAILFMPWTAWKDDVFDWGYVPYQYFAVEYLYTNTIQKSYEKLSWLNLLINDCHKRGIHVIMDGVFNHVGECGLYTPENGSSSAWGFAYYGLYQDPKACPYLGQFGGRFGSLPDLDFHNDCTHEFIRDVCFYWIDDFGIDGIRFDAAIDFYETSNTHGLPRLIGDIKAYVNDPNFSLTIEYIGEGDKAAASVANISGATSYWYNEIYWRSFKYLWEGKIDSEIVSALNTHDRLDLDKVATTYLSNHDHSHIAFQAGANNDTGSMAWYRTQPYAIALFTAPGTPLLPNGQEFAADSWLMEDDDYSGRRIRPRPLRWRFVTDNIGTKIFYWYQRLIAIRNGHAGLRSDNFYPANWESWQTQFNPDGYGVDVARQLVIFHRWGTADDGRTERFIVVLNFSSQDQYVDIPFSTNGVWDDILNNRSYTIANYRLPEQHIESNWGHIYFQTV